MRKAVTSKKHKYLVKRLAREREKAGLLQVDLAKKLECFQSRIARLESGDRRIDVIEYLEIAKAIGFDPYELLKDVNAIPD